MMYLSYLLIDVGVNPDRPRPGRLWLRNLYRVHQRLCMAFPSHARKTSDEHFLMPFVPEDFAGAHVHIARHTGSGFLFRIDPQAGGSTVILVQSAAGPDWDYAFHNAAHFLAAPPQVKTYDPSFTKGQPLKFRLLANPTRRCSRHSTDSDGNPIDPECIGKRIPQPYAELKEWLSAKGPKCGLKLLDCDAMTVQTGYIYVDDKKNIDGKRFFSVRYDGSLEVTDPARFRDTLARGIGPAKAFGFGLLSIAPA